MSFNKLDRRICSINRFTIIFFQTYPYDKKKKKNIAPPTSKLNKSRGIHCSIQLFDSLFF